MILYNEAKKHRGMKAYASRELCLKALADAKWKRGYVCKKCGHDNYCQGKSPWSRRCTRCKFDESATAYTIFHKCKIPIEKAFELAWLTCHNPEESLSSLSKKVGIRKMTCWRMKKMIQGCSKGNKTFSIRHFIQAKK